MIRTLCAECHENKIYINGITGEMSVSTGIGRYRQGRTDFESEVMFKCNGGRGVSYISYKSNLQVPRRSSPIVSPRRAVPWVLTMSVFQTSQPPVRLCTPDTNNLR